MIYRLRYYCSDGKEWCSDVASKSFSKLLSRLVDEAPSNALSVTIEENGEAVAAQVFSEEEREEMMAR